MKRLALLALLIATPALAQEMQYDLKVTATEANQIGAAINFLPKNVADPLLAKLTAQVTEQNAAAVKKADEAKKAAEAKKVEPAKK